MGKYRILEAKKSLPEWTETPVVMPGIFSIIVGNLRVELTKGEAQSIVDTWKEHGDLHG